MAETMTTEKLMPRVITLVSSSIGNGDVEFLHPSYPKRVHPATYIQYDTASYTNVIILNTRNETFGEIERPLEEMLEHDIVVRMSPKNSFTIKARITRISKAEPKIIIDAESTYLEP